MGTGTDVLNLSDDARVDGDIKTGANNDKVIIRGRVVVTGVIGGGAHAQGGGDTVALIN